MYKLLDIKHIRGYFSNMKNWITVTIILFLTSILFAGAYLEYFKAFSEGENIKIEWKTGDENNIRNFTIERKNPQSSYSDLIQIQPKGSNSYYSYVDESAYKGTDLIFVYRLKIIDNNNQISYSTEVSVIPNISSVKRTWGSIKAMFR